MRVAICDDLAEERKIIKNYLRRLDTEEHLELEIYEFDRGEALLDYMKKGKNLPDFLFLDIYGFLRRNIGNERAEKFRI